MAGASSGSSQKQSQDVLTDSARSTTSSPSMQDTDQIAEASWMSVPAQVGEDDARSGWNEKQSNDGHRPSPMELEKSCTRAEDGQPAHKTPPASVHRSKSTRREANGSTGISRAASNTGSVVSRMRSRPVAFSHPLSHTPTTPEQLVDFDGPDDPYRPINWPTSRKITTTVSYAFCTMTATYTSAAFASGTEQVANEFNIGTQTAILGTSLYLIGFGLGPLLWAPLSECYGRRPAVLAPLAASVVFTLLAGACATLESLFICRFFGAFFASAPITNTGGVLGDLYSPAYRGFALAGYALAVVCGPTIGPVVSAAAVVIAPPGAGWRWGEYIAGFLQLFFLIAAMILTKETYPPALLVRKAQRLRFNSGNWALHAKFEEWDVSFAQLASKFLVRPPQLLFTPACGLVALYGSFVFGILYMQLGAVPFIFHRLRGWDVIHAALPFLAICLGAFTGGMINCLGQIRYNRAYRAAGNRAVPEERLPTMMLGGIVFAAGQFITGWTADPTRCASWVPPVIGLYMTGMGFYTIFQATLNYLVDVFQTYAASAIATVTFLRSVLAAAFPLCVTPLYANMGVGPGSSVLAGFACLLIPVPFVFYAYGKKIRSWSKWSRDGVF